MTPPIRRFQDFTAHHSSAQRLRNRVRDAVVFARSLGRSIGRSSGWIRFPYYHHVFDDEREGFARQLTYLQQFGDFISLGDAVGILGSGAPIDGRYFCITFDDGYKNNLTNAVPILGEMGASAAFFLTTDYIDSHVEKDREHLLDFFDHRQSLMEFLSWDDCRELLTVGMEIGSHTVHHSRLSTMSKDEVVQELADSKIAIETNLGQPCDHFCAPFGIPIRDFNPDRDPALVRAAGYKSMLSTERGPMRGGGDPFRIRRDHVLANWEIHQLRYFLSLG